jgi:hypothetical protein
MRITKKELRDRVSSWDELQHEPVSVPPTNLKSLPKEAAQQAIIEWFGANFEDPVHCTPYISAEGGYQYIWGGPYDTRDIIENVFGDWLSESIIENVISELENEGYVWVPNSARRLPPDEDFEDDVLPDTQRTPAELHAAMLERLTALSELLDTLPATKPVGIGHNNPPDDIIDYDDIDHIRGASALLASQPIEPDDPSPARSAVQKFNGVFLRIITKLGEKADIFATEFAKNAGALAAKWGVPVIIADTLFGLDQVIITASEWLSSLNLPF